MKTRKFIEFLKKTGNLFPNFIKVQLYNIGNKVTRKLVVANWVKKGKPIPPPAPVKQFAIEEYKKMYNCTVFVETGTFLGNMIIAELKNFKQIYSIELSAIYFKRAKKLFKSQKKVNLLLGDSKIVLKELVPTLTAKTLFWLDAHYSGGITAKGDKESPIIDELSIIFNHNPFNHVILIDDARCFIGQHDYPTIEELKSLMNKYAPNYKMKIENDIIKLFPQM
jgi:hypothetical protein